MMTEPKREAIVYNDAGELVNHIEADGTMSNPGHKREVEHTHAEKEVLAKDAKATIAEAEESNEQT